MSYVYIASPYSDPDFDVMVYRYAEAVRFTAGMINNGLVCFSPIVHCHQMATLHDMPTDFKFWQNYCIAMLAPARSLIVLTLDGWQQSKGVAAETAFARDHKIPIAWMSP